MNKLLLGILLSVVFTVKAFAHEMTPTYPVFKPSHLGDVYVTTMDLFNKRQEIEYYEIGLFDREWNPIPFVTSYNVIKINYLGRVTFDIYVRSKDAPRAEYICSISKVKKEATTRTGITSRICSRFKD